MSARRSPGFHAPAALSALVLLLALAPARAAAPVAAPPLAERYRDTAARLIGGALASDHAYRRLSELCDGIGNRLSGSPALGRAIAWAAQTMREEGLENVRLQPVMVPHWVRGEEHAEMVEPGPVRLSMLGLGGSVATPPGGLTADVVRVTSFDGLDSLPDAAVRGRIVLYDVPFTGYGETVRYRSAGANRAAARGAVAMLLRSVGPVSLRTPHTGAMQAYVDSLPRIPGAAVTLEDATMMARLLAAGRRVRVHLEMGARVLPDTLAANVIGELRGRERPDEVVVLGGHLDSWDVGAGAQDDGGGCLVSLEAVRLMKALGLRPRRTVRCVFWVNEENGLRGGNAYADSLGASPRERHVAAIESDGGVERLVGFGTRVGGGRGDAVDSVRTARAVAQLKAIAPLLAGLGGDHMDANGSDADISPLMRRGVPGVAHHTTGEHYFDWHHTPADMLDKVDPVELRRNAAAMAVVAYILAEMPEPLSGSIVWKQPPPGASRGY